MPKWTDEHKLDVRERGKEKSDRLIDGHYLHSSTKNFLTSVNRQVFASTMSMENGSLSESPSHELAEAIERINNMIVVMNSRANELYKELGLSGRDTFSSGGFGNADSYSPAGAQEFSKKFLGLRKHKKTGSRRKKTNDLLQAEEKNSQTVQSLLNQTIDSEEAAEALRRIYQKHSNHLISPTGVLTFDTADKELIEIADIYRDWVGEEIIPKVGTMATTELIAAIDKMFKMAIGGTNKNSGVKSNDYLIFQSQLTGSSFVKQAQKLGKILGVAEAKNLKVKTSSKIANLMKAAMQRKLIDKGSPIFYEIALEFYDWIKSEIIKKRPENAGEQFDKDLAFVFGQSKRKYFATQFSTMVIKKKGVFFSEKDKGRGMVGFLGELSFLVSFNVLRAVGKEIVIPIGQENVTRLYQNVQYSGASGYNYKKGTYDRDTNKVTKNVDMEDDYDEAYAFTGESGSDMVIVGDSGKQYRIQVKNSFSDNDWHGIRLKSQFKLSTFVPTAFPKEQEDIIIYLLANYGYLNKYGKKSFKLKRDNNNRIIHPLEYDDQGEDRLTAARANSRIMSFINFFVQQSYLFLLGVETKEVEKLNENKYEYTNEIGNCGFIFRGEYFIPITMFLVGSLELLKNLLHKQGIKSLHGLGGTRGLTMTKLKADNPLGSPTSIQKEKFNILNGVDGFIGDSDEYPDRLFAYGSANGDSLYNTMSLNSISFNITIKNLEKAILKKY